MKGFKFLIAPVLLFVVIFTLEQGTSELKEGSITFVSFDARGNDSFSFVVLVNIKPNTTIYFTDSKWNGNRFSLNGDHMEWHSGDKEIKRGTVIKVSDVKNNGSASIGSVSQTMALNKNGDAIYGYIGSMRMPTKFLSAIATNKIAYGTLANTKLVLGKNFTLFPDGTYFAQFATNDILKDSTELIEGINDLNNYTIKRTSYLFEQSVFASGN